MLECSRASRVPSLRSAATPPWTRAAPSKSLQLRGMGHPGTDRPGETQALSDTGTCTGKITALARANTVLDVVHFS